MEPATMARALRLTAQTYRHTRPARISKRQLGTATARFTSAMALSGVSGRETRIRLASALLGREINSFSQMLGGEMYAILEEPKLPEIVGYLIKEQFSVAVQ